MKIYQCFWHFLLQTNTFFMLRCNLSSCIYHSSCISQLLHLTAKRGGLVLLPCYCTDLQTKPERFTWKKYNRNTFTWEEISSESGQYRDRVQLVNGHSPGNLSILISDLTEEDGGDYRCEAEGIELIDIRLLNVLLLYFIFHYLIFNNITEREYVSNLILLMFLQTLMQESQSCCPVTALTYTRNLRHSPGRNSTQPETHGK
uniref:Ig-like domain-containing protein n=1 Tax=Pygocentrus nattereri TaxID=42514 RepID=A0AAR2JH88_PYGNA